MNKKKENDVDDEYVFFLKVNEWIISEFEQYLYFSILPSTNVLIIKSDK
jgi:hypothetical protein